MVNDTNHALELKFHPNTIDDLGAKLYSTLPPVISELIANGYDAGASEIHIEFDDTNPHNKTISVKDNGQGMSFEQINDNYLVVGRKKREEKETKDPIFNRPVMGKKGIGKLSFFGITDHAEITTIQNGNKVFFEMNRNKIRGAQKYFPEYKISKSNDLNGTIVRLLQIKRDSGFDFQALKNGIANYFLFDDHFKLFVKHNNGNYEEITNETRYQQLDIQFTWKFPDDKYPYKEVITGKIFTTKKPLTKKLRGIALLSRKKLVNLPELFPIDSSSFFYEYLTGYLEIDFIDDLPEDVISTDRKTLSWGHPELNEFENWLRITIVELEKSWRAKWKKEKETAIKSNPKIDKKSKTIRTDKGKKNFNDSIESLAEANIDTESAIQVADKINNEYPEFHNKNLCPELATLTLENYKRGEYYDAVSNGIKRYITKIRDKISKQDEEDFNVVNAAFNSGQPALDVVRKYNSYVNASTRAKITDKTKQAISKGNMLLSQAMLSAFRNPLAHQEHEDLEKSEIYTVDDCLDALGLLSHLYKRLDNAENV